MRGEFNSKVGLITCCNQLLRTLANTEELTVNPLHPNIGINIIHTAPCGTDTMNLLNRKEFLLFVIIFNILMTLLFDSEVLL